jgi:3-isopropylmalate/(R)-2-methylmalate dehydratase large subunit
MGMTMIEKILARAAGRTSVAPGDLVDVSVDTCVPIDMNFLPGMWRQPRHVWDAEKVVVIFDHIVPAKDVQTATALRTGREFVKRFGITRFHDVGPGQGICHQLIADHAYALPGSILVCSDSHTCSGGAFNCAARGVGGPELIYVLTKGRTWFQVGETVRYVLEGLVSPLVTAKDVFLHIAGTYGDHASMNVEFVGPGVAAMTLDARRTLATMCAEISAEFATFEADDKVVEHCRARTRRNFEPQVSDPDARFAAIRTIDVGDLEPLVAFPGTVVNNVRPVKEASGIAIDQAFIGSCANGTLDDLTIAARIVDGRKVAPSVRFIVTPGSQAIYREALRRGIVATLMDAGALVTTSSCGACAGLQNGALGPGERCITSSTRNFKGRMGSDEAEIFMGSPATVAASAIRGSVADPREFI